MFFLLELFTVSKLLSIYLKPFYSHLCLSFFSFFFHSFCCHVLSLFYLNLRNILPNCYTPSISISVVISYSIFIFFKKKYSFVLLSKWCFSIFLVKWLSDKNEKSTGLISILVEEIFERPSKWNKSNKRQKRFWMCLLGTFLYTIYWAAFARAKNVANETNPIVFRNWILTG